MVLTRYSNNFQPTSNQNIDHFNIIDMLTICEISRMNYSDRYLALTNTNTLKGNTRCINDFYVTYESNPLLFLNKDLNNHIEEIEMSGEIDPKYVLCRIADF